MKLNIPPLGQRDARWASKRMGGGDTIGRYGCLLVCHSMALNYYGHEQTPDTLNLIFKEKGVYDGNLTKFEEAGNVYSDYIADEFYRCRNTPCDLSKVDKYLSEKKPVIAFVDNVDNDSKPDHFVLIIGKDEQGNYFINDPWGGETYYFHAKYGEPARGIYGLRLYSGNPPQNGVSLEDKVSDLEDKLSTCKTNFAQELEEGNTLRQNLKEQESDNADLAKQLLEARGKIDKESWEKKQLEVKIEALEDEVKKLDISIEDHKSQSEALRIALAKCKKESVEGLTKWDLFKLLFSRG